MGKIRELPSSSSRLLTSSQIISSVHCVVKELVENALDSGAKNVEVKLEDYGIDRIEVKDNGCGVNKSDIPFVAKSHFTSKISSYSDLDKVETYGFRGEALGAVCAVADLLIITRSSEETIGCATNFGHDGQVLSTKPCPCPQGTTVSVLNLFKNIPVRRQFYRPQKNKKEELHKVEELLIAYGIIQNDIRFALYHNKNLIWQKTALSSVKHALIQTMGNAVFEHMKCIDYFDEETQLKIEIYLPKPDAPLSCGFNSASKCILAVNRRPVRIKAIEKLLKEYYNESIKNSGRARFPICYVSFTVPPVEVDVNVEPNKTSVMLNHLEEILVKFSGILKDFYSQDKISDNNLNVQLPVAQDSSLHRKPTSNTTDFLESLKANCDAKLQQSVLAFSKSGANITADVISLPTPAAMTKKDICVIGDINEPRKKKMRTSLKASNDFENHINTLKEYYATEAKREDELQNSSSNSINAVTVKRVQSDKNSESTFEIHKTSAAINNINSNSITTFDISKDFLCDISKPLMPNQDKNHIGVNSVTSRVNNSEQVRNTASAVDNRIITFDISEDFLCDTSKPSMSNQDKNHIGVNSVTSGVNNSEQVRNTASAVDKVFCGDKAVHSALGQDRHLSHTPASSVMLSADSVQKSSTTDVQRGVLWSRGINPSGEQLQPVAVLQPKITTVPEKSPREANNVNILNKKSPPKQTSVSFERKLTAFDIFCRSNRLEVAAQNPEFNNHQIAQVLSEKWSHLSVEEKSIYKNMLDKDYPKEIKKKEKLGKTIIQNLSQDKKSTILNESNEKKFWSKSKSKTMSCSIEKIKGLFPLNRPNQTSDDLHIVNNLAPGIWVCNKGRKLYLLNTFRLQETVIYHRLLATFQFEIEPLEVPVAIPPSHLGDEAMTTLLQLSKLKSDNKGNICDEHLTANGFEIRVIRGEQEQVSVEMLGIANCSTSYGVSDLMELLLLIKKKGFSAELAECRPTKILRYLQSEANRMSSRSPAFQRLQDVEDLLCDKEHLIPNCNTCIHHKPFFLELWHINKNKTSDT